MGGKTVRKWISGILILAVVMLLTACGPQESDVNMADSKQDFSDVAESESFEAASGYGDSEWHA